MSFLQNLYRFKAYTCVQCGCMGFDELVTLVGAFVGKLFKEGLSPQLYFHNAVHTAYVVHAVREIGLHTGLTKQEIEIVTLAAWFHDTGYSQAYQNHELVSIEIAVNFLAEHGLEKYLLDDVTICILATRYPQKPNSLMEQVICDADFFHFSIEGYSAIAQSLKREWEEKLGIRYSQQEWDNINLAMLQNHQYFTPYGKEKLQEGKEKNIERLQGVL